MPSDTDGDRVVKETISELERIRSEQDKIIRRVHRRRAKDIVNNNGCSRVLLTSYCVLGCPCYDYGCSGPEYSVPLAKMWLEDDEIVTEEAVKESNQGKIEQAQDIADIADMADMADMAGIAGKKKPELKTTREVAESIREEGDCYHIPITACYLCPGYRKGNNLACVGRQNSLTVALQWLEEDEKIAPKSHHPENPSKPGGSTPSQYALPERAEELQDLIEHRDMNFSLGNIFKATYRLGTCGHSDQEYDLRKILFFAERELNRVTGEKNSHYTE